MKVERPAGVTAIAVAFLLAAGYLLVIGLTMLARPGLISMAAGAPLLGGLELAGPYMFLLLAVLGIVVGIGLLRLYNWGRWAAILTAVIGVFFCCPTFRARYSISISESSHGAGWGQLCG